MHLDLLLSLILLASAAGYLLLGMRLLVAAERLGNVPVGILSIVLAAWVAGAAVELLANDFALFSIGRTGHFVGTAFAPVAAYVCFREYAGRDTPTRMIVMLLIVPLVTVTLAATNAYHEFVWSLPATSEAGEFLTRPVSWGPWFLYVHAPFSYAVIGVAIITLMAQTSGIAPVFRRALFMLMAASLVPLVATLAYDLGLGPHTVSWVAFVLAAMLPVYAWLIVGEKVAEFAPLAYETVFQTMQDPVVVIDDHGRIIGMNSVAEGLLDVDERAALRAPLKSVFGTGATTVFEAIESGRPQKMLTDSGRFLHVQVSSIESKHGSARGGKVLMFRDVSDVERAQAEVRKSEKLLRTLIDHSVNGIMRLRWVGGPANAGRTLRCIFANAAAGRFLGVDADALVDREARGIVELTGNGMEDAAVARVLDEFERAVNGGLGIDVEVLHKAAGGQRWLRMICEPVGDDIAMTIIDVTDGKTRERQMESIAWSDPLTGVLNRRGFERDASKRLSQSEDDATGALLFIDLNDFKQINDRCGHEIGDELLRIAARRLKTSLRSCDIIGRPGGDEFVALVPDVSAKVADDLAGRLAASLEQPYVIGGEPLQCAASIGLALYPKNANTLTGLLRAADQAMYRAKARARDVSDIRGGGLLEKAI